MRRTKNSEQEFMELVGKLILIDIELLLAEDMNMPEKVDRLLKRATDLICNNRSQRQLTRLINKLDKCDLCPEVFKGLQ